MSVRLDKWLQVARMFKTRSQATRACSLGRVQVNGMVAKPHKNLAIGDTVELEKGDWERVLVVRELRDRPLPKKEASRVYEDQSPPKPERTELEKLLARAPEHRPKGAGRPTKKQRREIEKWRRGDD